MTGTPFRPLGACCLTALLLATVGAAAHDRNAAGPVAEGRPGV
jgi:hypothetical protein